MKKLSMTLLLIAFGLVNLFGSEIDGTPSASVPSSKPLEFENVQRSANYIEATIRFTETTKIYFYLQFSKYNSNTIAEVAVGGSPERYSNPVPTQYVIKTFPAGTHKFSIKLSGSTGSAHCLLYIARAETMSGASIDTGSNSMIQAVLGQ